MLLEVLRPKDLVLALLVLILLDVGTTTTTLLPVVLVELEMVMLDVVMIKLITLELLLLRTFELRLGLALLELELLEVTMLGTRLLELELPGTALLVVELLVVELLEIALLELLVIEVLGTELLVLGLLEDRELDEVEIGTFGVLVILVTTTLLDALELEMFVIGMVDVLRTKLLTVTDFPGVLELLDPEVFVIGILDVGLEFTRKLEVELLTELGLGLLKRVELDELELGELELRELEPMEVELTRLGLGEKLEDWRELEGELKLLSEIREELKVVLVGLVDSRIEELGMLRLECVERTVAVLEELVMIEIPGVEVFAIIVGTLEIKEVVLLEDEVALLVETVLDVATTAIVDDELEDILSEMVEVIDGGTYDGDGSNDVELLDDVELESEEGLDPVEILIEVLEMLLDELLLKALLLMDELVGVARSEVDAADDDGPTELVRELLLVTWLNEESVDDAEGASVDEVRSDIKEVVDEADGRTIAYARRNTNLALEPPHSSLEFPGHGSLHI
ncbi:hypothetical protein ACLMJK_009158 [Lecanora helva]